MAWSSPRDWTAGEVLTAANMDTYVSDNLTYLYDLRFGNGRRNALFNSHMDVWQRGTSVAINNSSTVCNYIADRWAMNRNATGSTGSRQTGPTGQSYALRIQRDSGDSSTAAITVTQALPTVDSLKLAGQTVQLKLNLAAGANFSATSSLVTVKVTTGTGTDQAPAASWTGTADALSQTQAITTTATDYEFNSIAIPSAATQVKVSVSFTPVGTASTNDWFQLAGAQLTVGKSPGWERLPVNVTLRECQAFYWQWGPNKASGSVVAIGQNFNTTTCFNILRWPVEMRRAPDVTFSANNDFSIIDAAGTSSVTAISASAVTSQEMRIDSTVGAVTAGRANHLSNNQDPTNAAIYATAEL